jgi:hypothetical protein
MEGYDGGLLRRRHGISGNDIRKDYHSIRNSEDLRTVEPPRSFETRVFSTLDVTLMNRLDDQFRDVDPRGQCDDRRDDLANIAWTQDQLPLLLGDRHGPLLEDWGIDFTGIDVGNSNPFCTDFVGHAGP